MVNMASPWFLVGHLSNALGIGEASRRLAFLLTGSGIVVETFDTKLRLTKSAKISDSDNGSLLRSGNFISCVNPDQLGALLSQSELAPSKLRRHIGFWSWELSKLPTQYERARTLVDEVWTVSNFCKSAFIPISEKKVRYIRLPVPTPVEFDPSDYDPSSLGLTAGKMLVTTSFDFLSDAKRKNPYSSIDAYRLAFKESDGVELLIKTVNGKLRPSELSAMKTAVHDRRDIVVFDGYISPEEKSKLLQVSDVFLSLHRSEGYGINIIDAMARKTAVIATGYSGNLDYMSQENSVLVPFELVPVREYAGLRVDDHWADPDVEFAADALKQLIFNEKLRKNLAEAGHREVITNHSLEAAINHFKDQFNNE